MTSLQSFLPLPQARFQVLVALSGGEMHGYAIMQAVEASSRGRVKMGPATLYGTLKKLLESHLVVEVDKPKAEHEDPRRRYYRLTGLGQRVCIAEADRLAALVRLARRNLGAEPA